MIAATTHLPFYYHVLAVDDNPVILTYLEKVLGNLNYFKITTSDNGREAIQWLERSDRENVHLIITDIYMPYVNGFELISYIRKDASLCATPVVVMSSSEENADKQKVLNLGADGFISKPCKPNDFVKQINYVLQNNHKQVV